MNNERYLTVYDVAKLYPGNGDKEHLHHDAVRKWITRGRLGVKLHSVVRGGRRVVRPTDLEAFDKAVEHRMNHGARIAEQLRENEKANENLKALGIEV